MEAFRSIRHKIAVEAIREHLVEASHAISVSSAIAIKAFGKNAPQALSLAAAALSEEYDECLRDSLDGEVQSFVEAIDSIDPVFSTCCVHTDPLQFYPKNIQKESKNPSIISVAGKAASICTKIRLETLSLEEVENLERKENYSLNLLDKQALARALTVKSDEGDNDELKKLFQPRKLIQKN